MFHYSYRNNDPSWKIKAEVIGFYSNTECYLWSRSAKAKKSFTPRKDRVQLIGRATWDGPSVRKSLKPEWGSVMLPHVEENRVEPQAAALLSEERQFPPSWQRTRGGGGGVGGSCAQGSLVSCSSLENLSVLDTEEKLFFLKKIDIIFLLQWRY